MPSTVAENRKCFYKLKYSVTKEQMSVYILNHSLFTAAFVLLPVETQPRQGWPAWQKQWTWSSSRSLCFLSSLFLTVVVFTSSSISVHCHRNTHSIPSDSAEGCAQCRNARTSLWWPILWTAEQGHLHVRSPLPESFPSLTLPQQQKKTNKQQKTMILLTTLQV